MESKAHFQGFHGLHMVGFDDPHLSWLPLTAWGVSANIHKLSLSYFSSAPRDSGPWMIHSSAILLSQLTGWSSNWSDYHGPVVLRVVCPLRSLPPQHPLLHHRQQVLLSAQFSPSPPSSLNSFAVTYKNKLWRNEIATKWVSPHFSDDDGCDIRKRAAKQGRCKKKADILFNLAMSGGMSGVSTNIDCHQCTAVSLTQSITQFGIMSATKHDFTRQYGDCTLQDFHFAPPEPKKHCYLTEILFRGWFPTLRWTILSLKTVRTLSCMSSWHVSGS